MTAPRTVIPVCVHPGAARNEVVAFTDGILRVNIAAPPVRGKANKELLDFICRRLALGKDRVSLIKGHTARNKVVAIDGLSREAVLELLMPGQDA
jgi:uncharacterized protein (TIGR00251 family)